MKKNILIIGTGFVSYSFLKNLKKSNFYNIFLSIDDRKKLIKFKNSSQINRFLGNFGTSNYWHSVSPTNGPKGYFNFFKNFYNINNVNSNMNLENSEMLFVPRKNFSLERAFNINVNSLNYKIINSRANQISKRKINLKSYSMIHQKSRLIIFLLETNILDLQSIIFKNLNIPDYVVYDHIQTHLGFVKRDQILNNKLIKPILSREGYYIGYESFNDKILMLRPFHSNIKTFGLKKFQNFGKSKIEIIKEIILSLSFSKLIHAFSTRYGLFFRSKYYSVFLQERIKLKDISIERKLSNEDIMKKLSGFKSLRSNQLTSLTGYSVFGNHQIGESKMSPPKGVIIANIKSKGWLKGVHHTLLNCFDAYNNNFET